MRSSARARGAPLVLAVAALAGCAREQTEEPVVFERPETAVSYEVELEGAPSEEIESLMRESLTVFRRQEDGAQSLAFLRRRARSDMDTARRILRSFGYYDGDASATVLATAPEPPAAAPEPEPGYAPTDGALRRAEAAAETGPERPPALVRIAVAPGPAFTLVEHRLTIAAAGERTPPPLDAAEFGSPVGEAAQAAEILAAEGRAAAALRRRGWVYAQTASRSALADPEADAIEVETVIEAGPFVTYGDLETEGLETVERDYVEGYAPWEAGAPVDETALAALQRELVETDLFDSISVRPPVAAPAADGPVPITLAAQEAPHRTVAAGLRWSTDRGLGGRARYEHRNLFGRNETLSAEANADFEEQSLEARYRVPEWLRHEQDFVASAGLRRTEADAFDETAATLGVGVERAVTDAWTLGAGGLLEATRTEDSSGDRDFFLFGLPFFARYDDTDDELNPSEGVRAEINATPFAGFASDDSRPLFTRLDGRASTYFALDAKANYILAGRARLGSILAERIEDVPGGRRLYSGGGGSVRGYADRSIGPLDDDDDPTGGLSVVEIGAELRAQIAGPVGFAAFVEGGAVSEERWPDFNDGMQVAAGLGARYYSPIGPIRMDVGVPLNPRDSDDDFQIYLAIGQAY